MTQVLFNNILATIGALTGISGLVISIFLLRKERIKFSVFHPSNEDKSSYVGFNGIYDGQNKYGEQNNKYTPYLLLIWLQIANKSKVTTTILEMSLKIDKCRESILYNRTSDNYIIAVNYSIDEHNEISVHSSWGFHDITKPPITIQAYSAIEGYFYFRDLDLAKSESYKAILKIVTTQGTKKYKIVIRPYFPLLDNQ